MLTMNVRTLRYLRSSKVSSLIPITNLSERSFHQSAPPTHHYSPQTSRNFVKTASKAQNDQALYRFSKYQLNPQVLKKVVDFGQQPSADAYHASCEFLASEGAIRLAHMIAEFRSLPENHLENPHLHQVHEWYTQSFDDMTAIRKGQKNDKKFRSELSDIAQKVLRRHSAVVMEMAKGIYHLRNTSVLKDESGMNEFLDRFFMSRIAIRFLFNQHLQVFKDFIRHEDCTDVDARWVGSIDTHCSVGAVTMHAAESARLLCMENYFDAPEVEIVHEYDDTDSKDTSDGDRHTTDGGNIIVTCIPSHLYHIMFELFKNSCRAVTEHHEANDGSEPLPPIRVTIIKSKEDLSIKISDRGGGIAHRSVPDIFSYHYSTAETPALLNSDENERVDMNHAPLAGFGYGIPVSRLYARYFGGDLTINSLDGYGTDAYVHLRSNPLEAMEVLPSANQQEIEYVRSLDRPSDRGWRHQYTNHF